MKCPLYLFHFLLLRTWKNVCIQICCHSQGFVSKDHLQGFHVSALFYVSCCKGISEGMVGKSLNHYSLLPELIQNIVYRITHCMGCNRLGSIAPQEDVITQLSHENVPVENRNLILLHLQNFFYCIIHGNISLASGLSSVRSGFIPAAGFLIMISSLSAWSC